MICPFCKFENDDLNPFSKCLRCGMPIELQQQPRFGWDETSC